MADRGIAADKLAVAICIVIILYVISLILELLKAVSYWKIFKKAGEKGWKSLIPFLNRYLAYRFAWRKEIYWLELILFLSSPFFTFFHALWLCVLLQAVLRLLFFYRLAKAFGKGIGYTIGLFLLQPLFAAMLGFGGAEYRGEKR